MSLPGDPSMLARLRYVYGGRLPADNLEWVRHDLTDAGWRLRALGRLLIQLVTFSLPLALLPGPGYLHVLLPAFVVLSGLFVGTAYGDDLRDLRLRQHGLPPAGDGGGRP